MIIGNINQLDQSKVEYPTAIYHVLDTIRHLDFAKHPNGEMTKNHVLFKTFCAITAPVNERILETHQQNIDVQFVISGIEAVRYLPVLTHQSDDPKPADDNYFYHHINAQAQQFILAPGDFAILFPWDIHASLCQVNEKQEVRKIVAKVPLSLLTK